MAMRGPTNNRPSNSPARRGAARGATGRGAGSPTAALFVRIPSEHARRLDRAALELKVPKQSLVSGLVERYVDPDSPSSLAALHEGYVPDTGSRRVRVETIEPEGITVGHHSFRPREPEVLTPEEAAELLQVEVEVIVELATAGELPGRRLGEDWRFARKGLLDWLGGGAPSGHARPDARDR